MLEFNHQLVIEFIGWTSTATFLVSILVKSRLRLHELGVFTAVTTGIYAFSHAATAIWVKWLIAFFFHTYMIWKLRRSGSLELAGKSLDNPDIAAR